MTGHEDVTPGTATHTIATSVSGIHDPPIQCNVCQLKTWFSYYANDGVYRCRACHERHGEHVALGAIRNWDIGEPVLKTCNCAYTGRGMDENRVPCPAHDYYVRLVATLERQLAERDDEKVAKDEQASATLAAYERLTRENALLRLELVDAKRPRATVMARTAPTVAQMAHADVERHIRNVSSRLYPVDDAHAPPTRWERFKSTVPGAFACMLMGAGAFVVLRTLVVTYLPAIMEAYR